MITWLRVLARTIVFRFPILTDSFRMMSKKTQKLRESRNINSLLAELHSDTALQLPLLVEQNRKMFREIESLKIEIEHLREIVETKKKL
jgi:hypothetical protein